MLRFVLMDDEPIHSCTLSHMLQAAAAETATEAEIALVTTDPGDVLAFAAKDKGQHVFFLDIETDDDMDGIQLSLRLTQIDPECRVVFVSAYQQYAMACLHAHAFDFLIKPLSRDAVRACMTALRRDLARKRPEHVLPVDLGSTTVLLDLDEVLYFSKERNDMVAHLPGRTTTWRENFAELEARLPAEMFFRIHRKHLCSLRQVVSVDWADERLTLAGGETLPFSRRATAELRAKLTGPAAAH